MCQMKSPVRECQWSWRQLNQSQPWNLEVKRFPAFGNDSTDCSIKFKNVLPEQEGYWTCGARIDPNSSFTQSNPIRFLISEGERRRISRNLNSRRIFACNLYTRVSVYMKEVCKIFRNAIKKNGRWFCFLQSNSSNCLEEFKWHPANPCFSGVW